MDKKILFVYYSCSIGGGQTKLRNRLESMTKAGWDCEIIFYWGGQAQKWFSGFHTTIISEDEKTKGRKIELDMRQRVVNTIRHGNYDYIISFDHILVKALRMCGYKGKIIYEHIYPQWFSNLETINAYPPDSIIVPSKYHKNKVKKYLKKEIPIHDVPNCLGDEFKYIPHSEDRMQSFITPSVPGASWKNRKIIAWVGRLVPMKNLKEFISIAEKLVSGQRDIAFWIITNATDKDVRKYIKDHLGATKYTKIASSVFVLGNIPIDQMPYIYSYVAESGGCSLSTSKAESFGNTFMESMACQCPAVAANSSAGAGVIKDKITGLVYEPGNVNDAIKQIKKIFINKKLRQRIIQYSLEYILVTHSQEAMLRKFESIFMSKE